MNKPKISNKEVTVTGNLGFSLFFYFLIIGSFLYCNCHDDKPMMMEDGVYHASDWRHVVKQM